MLRVEQECDGDGVRITSILSTDRMVEIPDSIDGRPVTAIGPRVLGRSQGVQGRTLRIPATVVDIDGDALEGSTGLAAIEYGGGVEAFSRFGLTASSDCKVRFGDGFSFEFKGGVPMGFPAFDDAMMAFASGLTLETAMARLKNPVGLTEANRDGYRRFVSERIMPRAERAVASGDTGSIKELLSTGMIGDADLRSLLRRSARSGKVAVTSMLMSEISSRSRKRSPVRAFQQAPDVRSVSL